MDAYNLDAYPLYIIERGFVIFKSVIPNTFLREDSDGLLPGRMRRDINSLLGRIASLSRKLCGRETTHALVEKKGKAKVEYYGKYGYIKNHKKTVKNGQARTRERKSEQKPEVKVNLGQASVKEKVNQGASLNQGSKRTIQELVNKMAGIDQSNQRISLAHSQAQATCDEEKAQRDVGFALNALSKQTQLSLKRIATLAIRVSSLVIQRWTRRNQ
ncbi:hypothetical protein Tco_0562672 [Tanacetum coccineum]